MWNRTVVLFLKHPLPLFVRGGIFQRLIIVQPVVTTMDRIDAILIQLGVLILIITIASVFEILALILFVGVFAIVLILAALFLVEV